MDKIDIVIKKLYEAMVNSNLSYADLAVLTGMPKSVVHRYVTGTTKNIPIDRLEKLSKALGVETSEILGWTSTEPAVKPVKQPGFRIPVLGKIAAGVPVEAIEDVVDWEEITQEEAQTGVFFGLQIKGDSMEPKFSEGDVVIVRQQSDCETGQVAVIIVNGCDATVKRIKKRPEGIMLIPTNPEYEPMFYSSAEMESLPITIIGRVVELQAKF